MNNEEIKAVARVLFEEAQETLMNLHARWQDENEYEDIKDYIVALEEPLKKAGAKFPVMTAKPFGFRCVIEDVLYQYTLAGNKYSYARLVKNPENKKEYKLVKKSVGERDNKGNFTEWSFLINGVEVAHLEKTRKGESRGRSRLITHYRVAYSFSWRTAGLLEVFNERFTSRGCGHLHGSTPDLWNDYDAYSPATRPYVVEMLNEAISKKGIVSKVC